MALAVAGGLAQSEPSQESLSATVHERLEGMEQFGALNKAIIDELKKEAPDIARVAADAATLHKLATALPGWFPAGSAKALIPESEAKDEIWTDTEGFQEAIDGLQGRVSQLNEAAMSGELEDIKTAAGEIGGGCGGCHRPFREQRERLS